VCALRLSSGYLATTQCSSLEGALAAKLRLLVELPRRLPHLLRDNNLIRFVRLIHFRLFIVALLAKVACLY
jgi:hypothetical protein